MNKCEKAYYKNILKEAIINGDNPVITDTEDFAAEIAEQLNFYEAGKKDNSFKLFIEELDNCIKRI